MLSLHPDHVADHSETDVFSDDHHLLLLSVPNKGQCRIELKCKIQFYFIKNCKCFLKKSKNQYQHTFTCPLRLLHRTQLPPALRGTPWAGDAGGVACDEGC